MAVASESGEGGVTYGPDAQPDVLFQGDGLKRGLCRAENRVRCMSREIRLAASCIRRGLGGEVASETNRRWIKNHAWPARREAQQAVIAYRGLIAEREMQRSVLGVS